MKCHTALAIVVATLFLCGEPPAACARQKVQHQGAIRPLHALVTYHPSSETPTWSPFVYSESGRKAYLLWLFLERDVNQRPIGVDLVLNRAGDKDWDGNLLNPRWNWHGLQPYMFVASDFSNGPGKSIFGPRRVIRVERIGILVKIDVLDAHVHAPAKDDYEFTELRMDILVDNLNTQSSFTETR